MLYEGYKDGFQLVESMYNQKGTGSNFDFQQIHQAVSCSKLSDVKSIAVKYEVVGVDEGQFFPDVVEFCEQMAKLKKTVIVAALDGDFQRKAFGNILKLVPLAESVVKLSAVCMNCYGEGAFTKRLISDTTIEVIGGADKYMAACRDCHAQVLDIDTLERQKEKIRQKRQPLMAMENISTSKLFHNAANASF